MIKILDLPIYHTTVVMMAESSPREWEEFYHLYEDKLTESDFKDMLYDIQNKYTCNGFTRCLDKGDYAFYIRYKEYYGDIAHEIFHVANKILCKCGVFHEADGEAWAYLIGYITEQFYDMLEGKSENVFTTSHKAIQDSSDENK